MKDVVMYMKQLLRVTLSLLQARAKEVEQGKQMTNKKQSLCMVWQKYTVYSTCVGNNISKDYIF